MTETIFWKHLFALRFEFGPSANMSGGGCYELYCCSHVGYRYRQSVVSAQKPSIAPPTFNPRSRTSVYFFIYCFSITFPAGFTRKNIKATSPHVTMATSREKTLHVFKLQRVNVASNSFTMMQRSIRGSAF